MNYYSVAEQKMYSLTIDGDVATSKLLSNSFFNFDIETLSNNKLTFINFTETLLVKRFPTLFPKDKIIVEVLENVAPTDDVLEALVELAESGYKIALDDFEYDPSLDCLIDLCSIIKIDIRLTPLEEARELMEQLAGRNITFLAEKVETYDEFQETLQMGFELFQGYFFSKPEVIGGATLESSGINMLQLMAEVYKDEYNIDKIGSLIHTDVNISYKLFRYINSAAFSREQEITSVKHAIAYLGIHETRRFISLVALSEASSSKPSELILSAIIKARFCELIGGLSNLTTDPDQMFTLGLFSMIDAMLDTDMETLMEKLPLVQPIKQALISREGELADFLLLCSHYEAGDWKRCTKLIHKYEIEETQLPESYFNALSWANEFTAISS